MQIALTLQCPLFDSERVQRVREMFDLHATAVSRQRVCAELPGPDEPWAIGVIVGPSGSGKTTIARAAFGSNVYPSGHWADERAVIDGFGDRPLELITRVLSAVGFSSVPSWLKPYAVLSTGERFRCELARALLSTDELVVFDEYTSALDRTVARFASSATAKAIRSEPRLGIAKRFVAVTCHHDIVEWLEPDWVLDMGSQSLARGRLRRPWITVQCRRADRSIWSLFKRHHYLNGDLHRTASCYLATIAGNPTAFTAVLPHPHPTRPGYREHRTVCLPDYQGVGIGSAISEFVASLYVATGRPYFSTTAHPAMIAHRLRSPLWQLCRKARTASLAGPNSVIARDRGAANSARITAGFEYIGPPRALEAKMFGTIPQSRRTYSSACLVPSPSGRGLG
jgi:hypothetical protein